MSIKKLLVFVIIVAVMLAPLTAAFAEQESSTADGGSPTAATAAVQNVSAYKDPPQMDQPKMSSDFKTVIDHESSSFIENMIASLIGNLTIAAVYTVNKWMQFKDYADLLFNGGKAPDGYIPIDAGMWNQMDKWYGYMMLIIGPIMLLSVIIMAVKFIVAGYNPKLRGEAKDHFMRIFLAAIIMIFTPVLIHALFFVNNSLVRMLAEIVKASNISAIDDHLNLVNVIKDIKTGSAIADAFVLILFGFIEIKLNLMFIIRMFTLIIFYIFTPIVALMWTIDRNINAMGIWLGEILSNVFMQFFYAFVFMVYISLVTTAGWGNWVQSIVWAMLLLPVGDVLRNSMQGYMTRLSGLNESTMANQAMGFLGLAGITSVASSMAAQFAPLAAKGGAVGKTLEQVITGSSSAGRTAASSAGVASNALSTGSGTNSVLNTTSEAPGVSAGIEGSAGSEVTAEGSSTPTVGIPTGGTVIGVPERLVGVFNSAQAAGYYTQRSIHAAGKFPAFIGSAVFGEKSMGVLNNAAKAAGTAVKTVVGGAATVNETRKLAKDEGIGFMDALGRMTGTENKWQAGWRAVSLNVSNAVSGPQRIAQKMRSYGINTSIDGIRYK